MIVYQSWYRNKQTPIDGDSITAIYRYTSFNKSEIDELEQTLPKGGLLVIDMNTGKQIYPSEKRID